MSIVLPLLLSLLFSQLLSILLSLLLSLLALLLSLLLSLLYVVTVVVVIFVTVVVTLKHYPCMQTFHTTGHKKNYARWPTFWSISFKQFHSLILHVSSSMYEPHCYCSHAVSMLSLGVTSTVIMVEIFLYLLCEISLERNFFHVTQNS